MKRNYLFKVIVSRLRKEGVKKIAVFGSYARHEERKKSDIDLIVAFKGRKTLLDIAKIQRELSEATGKNVDLLSEGAIHPLLKGHIKREMEVLYER